MEMIQINSPAESPFRTTKIKLRPKYGPNIVYCNSPSGSIPVRTPVLDTLERGSPTKYDPIRSQTYERIHLWRVQCMEMELSKENGNKTKKNQKSGRTNSHMDECYAFEKWSDTWKPLRLTRKFQGPVDSQRKHERDYVSKTFLPDSTRETFPDKILKKFFKPPKSEGAGYGMPRPFTREVTGPNENKDSRAQRSYVRIGRFPKLTEPIVCEHSTQFCEILGPSTCSKCIEKTNRVISDEIQTRMFAKTTIDPTNLVVPILSRVLKEKHPKPSEGLIVGVQ